jgi:thiol-disulfide isomerase/thioredoxin
MPYQDFEVSESYYDFLPKEVADKRLFVLSNGYYFFVNRLIYADVFNVNLNSKLTKVDIANWLQENGIELTDEELNMVEWSTQIETPEALKKEVEFNDTYGAIEQGFYKKYKNHFSDVKAYLKSNEGSKQSHFILYVVDYLNEKDIKIAEDEAEMVEALRTLKSPEEIEAESSFNKKYSAALISFRKKYQDDYSKISSDWRYAARDKKIKTFFGKENAFLFDVIKMQELSKQFEDYIVYSDEALVNAQQELDTPFLKNYLALTNAQTKEKIQINKTKGGYTVHNVEKTEGDELFDAMLKKFKGKVVYVDFWATWCGPCMSGIKKIAPLKEEMKDDNVVFLYITNQSSPEGTWKNSIANIKGEHYRVSTDEWNYLADKFNISGIPHYTLVDKEGQVVKSKMRHNSNEGLKNILRKEI